MLIDHAQAFERHRQAAETGDRTAQAALGLMFALGLGVAQDLGAAIRWLRAAADRGDTRAQCNLGFMYGTGRGVPQDFVHAYAWYNLAAAGGEDVARRNRDIVCERMSTGQLEEAQRLSLELFDILERG